MQSLLQRCACTAEQRRRACRPSLLILFVSAAEDPTNCLVIIFIVFILLVIGRASEGERLLAISV